MLDRDLRKRNDLGLLEPFESEVEGEDDRDIDIRRDKRFSIPVSVEEYSVTTEEQEDGERDQRRPGCVRLERGLPWEIIARDFLFLHTKIEAEINGGDDDPTHQHSYRDEVLEPAENGGGGMG